MYINITLSYFNQTMIILNKKIIAGNLDFKTAVVIMKNVNGFHSGKCLLQFIRLFIRRITENHVREPLTIA
jgi:hypothetical protein